MNRTAMNPAAEILSHVGPAIPAQPAAPLELEFSLPGQRRKKVLTAVVLVHLQHNLISRRGLCLLQSSLGDGVKPERGDAPILISNLKGGHYIVQDKLTLALWKKSGPIESFQETFYVETNGDDGEEWDWSIDVILSPEQPCFQGLGQYTPMVEEGGHDYMLGVFFFTADNNYQIRRRLAVVFKSNVNILPDTIQKELNIRMEPYSGQRVTLANRGQIQPIGTIKAPWKIVGKHKVYWTTFYVIRDDCDTQYGCLGRPSVMEHGLFNVYEDR